MKHAKMKKVIFSTILLAILALTNTHAQVRDNLSLGPIAGFGHSWVNKITDNSVSTVFNPSFNGGARLVYSATPHIGFGIDATFRNEGIKVKDDNYLSTNYFNYINLDPKVYYFFGQYGQAFRPKIGVGPNFGFLVGGKSKTKIGTNTIEVKSKDYFKGFNFGLAGTIGFNYRLKSKTWLNVDAVYNNGLSDLTKDDTNNPNSRSIFLNVGVTFGIGHVEKK